MTTTPSPVLSDLCELTEPHRCWVCRTWWMFDADDKECLDAQAGIERCVGPSPDPHSYQCSRCRRYHHYWSDSSLEAARCQACNQALRGGQLDEQMTAMSTQH